MALARSPTIFPVDVSGVTSPGSYQAVADLCAQSRDLPSLHRRNANVFSTMISLPSLSARIEVAHRDGSVAVDSGCPFSGRVVVVAHRRPALRREARIPAEESGLPAMK